MSCQKTSWIPQCQTVSCSWNTAAASFQSKNDNLPNLEEMCFDLPPKLQQASWRLLSRMALKMLRRWGWTSRQWHLQHDAVSNVQATTCLPCRGVGIIGRQSEGLLIRGFDNLLLLLSSLMTFIRRKLRQGTNAPSQSIACTD